MSEQNNPKQYPFPVSCNELGQRDQRALIFHLLYAVDSFDYEMSLAAIAENIGREYGFIINSQDAVFQTVESVTTQRADLDKEIEPLLANWRFDRLSVATRLIVRYAVWELLNNVNPPSVVINEAVELAKCFAESNAYRFVNGVLDEWAKRKGLTVTTTEESE